MAKAHEIDTGHIDRGALRARLGIPEDREIPASVIREDLRNARRRHDVEDEKQDVFALNARDWDHTGGK